MFLDIFSIMLLVLLLFSVLFLVLDDGAAARLQPMVRTPVDKTG
jgi:hypothetical protein